MNFAPVVDVNNNPENPVIHDRSFGDDKERVARLGIVYAHGLQDAGVIACAKHFPGHGDTNVDSHVDLPLVAHSTERLNSIEFFPFKKLIDAGVGAVMNAHLAVPELDSTCQPSTLSYAIVTQELKNKLNFKGLVITDALGMGAITNYYEPGDLELQAFLAGNDILLCPLDVPYAIDLIEKAIKAGRVTEDDLDQRVLKILKAKEWAFEQHATIDNSLTMLTRPEALDLQKKLFNNALTIAKTTVNSVFNQQTLQNSCIIQIGTLPHNELTTSLYYPVYHCSSKMSDEELQRCLQRAQDAMHVIIGVSEMNKFAQQNFGIAPNSCALIKRLKDQGKEITVIIFGTPYSVKSFPEADTIIVAYEDAIPMQRAVADLLHGTLQAQGKLPVAI